MKDFNVQLQEVAEAFGKLVIRNQLVGCVMVIARNEKEVIVLGNSLDQSENRKLLSLGLGALDEADNATESFLVLREGEALKIPPHES